MLVLLGMAILLTLQTAQHLTVDSSSKSLRPFGSVIEPTQVVLVGALLLGGVVARRVDASLESDPSIPVEERHGPFSTRRPLLEMLTGVGGVLVVHVRGVVTGVLR